MEIEEGQAKVIEQFVNKVSILETTSSLANLIAPHASLYAFSDILSLPNLLQPQGAEDSAYLDLLRLFAYGTWRDYKIGVPMRQPLLATFRLATSDSVPPLIEEKIDWASKMCQLDMDHQQKLQGRIYEAKKDINFKSKQGHCFWENVDDCDYLNGPLEQEDDPVRSERRRSQHTYSGGRPVYVPMMCLQENGQVRLHRLMQGHAMMVPTSYGIRGASINGNIRDLHGDFSMIPRW